MLRHEVLQGLIDLFDAPSYLEIGVDEGTTLHRLKAATKTAVDPAFKFDVQAAKEAHPSTEYLALTSDEFFKRALARRNTFDVIFLDGLHTFDQILKDLLNAIFVLNPSGVIVIDDVLPSDYAAAASDIPTMFAIRHATGSAEASWMGDVFKVLFFLADFLIAFDYASLRENHGQTVLWRANRDIRNLLPTGGMRNISSKEYKDSLLQPSVYRFQPFDKIVQSIKTSHDLDSIDTPASLI